MRFFCLLIVMLSFVGCGVKDVTYYHKEGVTYEKKGDMAKAATSYMNAYKLDEKHFYTLYNLGNVYYAQKNYSAAKTYYIKSILVRTNFFPAYFNLGLTYMELKEYKKGYESFKQASLKEGKGIEAILMHASYLVKNGENKKALRLLNRAKVKARKDYRVFFNLGFVLLEMEKKEQASKILEKAIKMKPKDAATNILLARCYLLFTKDVAALEKAGKIISALKKSYPKNKNVMLVSARYDIAKNRWGSAFKLLIDYTERYPDAYDAHMLLGRYYLRRRKLKKALVSYKKAASIEFSKRQPLIKIAEIEMMRKKYRSARKILNRLFRYFPNSEVVLLLNLRLNYKMAEYERAIRYGDKLLALNAKSVEGKLLTGLSYLRVEDDSVRKPKKAVKLLWPLLKTHKKNKSMLRYLYRALKELKDMKRANEVKKVYKSN